MKITIHEEKNSHFTFHGEKKGPITSHENTLYHPLLRACLHGGGGPQVGEVTRLAVVDKWPAFTCKFTTPGSWGDVTRHCCVFASHVNRDNGGRTTHFCGQCSFPFSICSRCSISMLWLFTVTFDDISVYIEARSASKSIPLKSHFVLKSFTYLKSSLT